MRTCHGAILAGALLLAAPAAAAEPERLDLQYSIYLGGLSVLELSNEARLADGAYRIDTDIETRGLLDLLAPFAYEIVSEGRRDADGLKPDFYREQRYKGSKKKRLTEVTYHPDGTLSWGATPARDLDPDDVEPTAELVAGTLDPVSGILLQTWIPDEDAVCGRTARIFDGAKRYDLVLEPLGEERFEENRYSIWGGVAQKCRATIEYVAGFEANEDGSWKDPFEPFTVWLGRLGPETGYVPVRADIESEWGRLTLHLTGYAVDGARTQTAAGETPPPEAPDHIGR